MHKVHSPNGRFNLIQKIIDISLEYRVKIDLFLFFFILLVKM